MDDLCFCPFSPDGVVDVGKGWIMDDLRFALSHQIRMDSDEGRYVSV